MENQRGLQLSGKTTEKGELQWRNSDLYRLERCKGKMFTNKAKSNISEDRVILSRRRFNSLAFPPKMVKILIGIIK